MASCCGRAAVNRHSSRDLGSGVWRSRGAGPIGGVCLGFVAEHPVATALIAVGGVVLLVLLARFFWVRATKLREQVKTGGAILGRPRRFLIGVALPEFGSYLAQQLIISAWDVVFAIGLVSWVFGWSGGKQLVRQSYAEAGVKEGELKAQRKERRTARRERWQARRSRGPDRG
jgi:hypothetical protein